MVIPLLPMVEIKPSSMKDIIDESLMGASIHAGASDGGCAYDRSWIMASSINITFLGTGSATPCFTRNQSALALRLDGDVWIFDCGEATLSQIQKSNVKMGRIQKVFITHTHGKGS